MALPPPEVERTWSVPPEQWREIFERYVREVTYGTITVTKQGGQVVRVEKSESTLFPLDKRVEKS